MVVKPRASCCVSAVQPASSPTKCGAKMTVGAVPESSPTAPVMRRRLSTVSGRPCHSQPRSSQAWAKYTKQAKVWRRRSCLDHAGKHRRKLVSTTRRREPTSTYSSAPSSQPKPRSAGSGSTASARVTRMGRWLSIARSRSGPKPPSGALGRTAVAWSRSFQKLPATVFGFASAFSATGAL